MKKSILFLLALFSVTMTTQAAYYYRGEKNKSGNDWLAGIELTESTDGYYAYYSATAGAHQFKICTAADDWGATSYNCNFVTKNFNNTDIADIGDYGGDNCYTWTNVAHYIIVYYPNTKINATSNPIICASTFLPDDSETESQQVVYYYRGEKNKSGNDWLAGIELTESTDGYYAYYSATAGAHQFKICTAADDWGATSYNCNFVTKNFNNTDIADIGDYGGDNCYTWTNVAHYIIVYYPNTKINATSNPIICASTFLPDDSETDLPEPEPDPTPEVYTVVGGSAEIFGSAWTPGETANDMTKQADGTYKFVKENVTLAASNIEYKVVKDHKWGDGEYPTQGNQTLKIEESGVYDITFTYTVGISLTDEKTLKQAIVVLPTIELAGTMNGCDDWGACKKTLTPAEDNLTASITVTLAPQEYSFKIVKAGEWLGNKGKMERNSSTGWTFEKLDGGDETNCRIVADATGDYTFTWTYATNTLTVTYPAETGEEIQHTYTVVGPEAMFGTNWDPSNTANDMTKQEDGTYTKTIENVTLAAEATNEYKIVRDHSWEWKELSGDDNLTFSVDKSGIYNLTFVLNADATEASVTTSLLEETDVVLDAYVAGNEALTGSNFSLEEKNKMTYDSETKTYSHTLTGLKASTYYELKVVHGSSWLGYDKLSTVPQGVTEGNSQNICFQLASDGNLVVTYNATTGITLNGNFYVFDGSNQPSTLYFRPNTAWKSDNARFAAYFFGTTETWVDMTDANGDGIYEVANDKTNANVIFCRMNPSTAENKWDNLWNQTIDIQIPNTTDNPNTVWASWKNVYKESDEDTKLYGTWVVPETIGSGDNSAFYTKYSGQTINVIVERTFEKEVLHTLCLPFSLPAGWIGTAYQLSGVQSNNAEELVLYVKECSTFEAGKPYIVEPTNEELASKEYLLVDNVTISTSLASNSVSNKTHVVTLKGILNGGGQTDGAREYYIGTDGALHKEATNKLALRSIVEITDISGNPVQGVRARVAFNENVETGVEDIIATDAPVKVIVNGQLIIIRDGVKYNVQGQKL